MEWGKVSVGWKIIYLTEEDDIPSGHVGHVGHVGHDDLMTPRYV
jgi:hypothetical protein